MISTLPMKMEKPLSIFKKAYEEGLQKDTSNFESWINKFGLNSILLDKFVNSVEDIELFFNRNQEIERIAQFTGVQERQKKFGYVNLVGAKGIGKTSLLNVIFKLYNQINPNSVVSISSEKFAEYSSDNSGEDEEPIFYFEVFLEELKDKKLILIDECEKDSLGDKFFILSWRPIHFNKFKIEYQDKLNLEECILLKPFDKSEISELLKTRLKKLKIDNKESISPFNEESLSLISELSQGIPKLALSLSYKAIKKSFHLNNEVVSRREVLNVYKEEGFEEVQEFIEKCTPITRKILKTVLLDSYPKGVSIDKIAEEVDLDRTTVFYHLQKMRNISLLNENYSKKTVYFLIKEDFLPLIEKYLWESRGI